MSPDQRNVALAMVAAAAVSVTWIWLGLGVCPCIVPALTSVGERLAWAARWELLPGLTLLAGIAKVAQGRFFSQEHICGEPPAETGPTGHALAIDLRYIQNTTEQLLLALPAHLALASLLEGGALRVLPVLCTLFFAGRIAFWAGYRRLPIARSVGFGMTFYPTAGVYLYLGWRLLAG